MSLTVRLFTDKVIDDGNVVHGGISIDNSQ